MGRRLSRLHGRAGADGLAADRDVGPQLDDAAHDHRRDPQRPRVEGRQLHAAAEGLPLATVFYGIATIGGTQAYQKRRPRAKMADKLLDAAARGAIHAPTPTTSSTSGTPRATTIPRRAWRRITAALLAINSADDERNPPETGVMERELKRVKNGTLLLDPGERRARAATAPPAMAKFYKRELAEFLAVGAEAWDVGRATGRGLPVWRAHGNRTEVACRNSTAAMIPLLNRRGH